MSFSGWMEAFWIGLGVVVAFLVVRRLFAWFVMRLVARIFGEAIGRQALASQPDTITLEEVAPDAWRDPIKAAELCGPLLDRGFQDAGTFRIREMDGVLVRLYAQPHEDWLAAVYEHPAVGQWIDLCTKFADDTSLTFTTSAHTGLDPRPGHPVVNCPGLDPNELYSRATRERPYQPRCSALPQEAVHEFTKAYEDSMRWRKQVGISAREVGNVAGQMDRAA